MPEPLILIPGLLNDAELWRDQTAAIDGCIVGDITGSSDLGTLARQVLTLVNGPFALAGFSLGGIVAQEIARIAPDRVSRLALLDTTMLADSPARAADRERLIRMARTPGKFHGFGDKLLQTYLAPENLTDHALVERVRSMTERLGAEVFIRQSLIDRPDSRDTLAVLRCPTLILCGAHDVLTPPDLHRDMAALVPHARLTILPGAGHLTPLEQPEAVTAELQRLLAA